MAVLLMASIEAESDPLWTILEDRYFLSPREIEVAAGIWHGHKYTAIARHMGISKHGVDAHWRSIKVKMRVRTHADIIRLIARLDADERLKHILATLMPKMLPASGSDNMEDGATGRSDGASD
jgi:DNA-binding CsgD family transcriptional regulator